MFLQFWVHYLRNRSGIFQVREWVYWQASHMLWSYLDILLLIYDVFEPTTCFIQTSSYIFLCNADIFYANGRVLIKFLEALCPVRECMLSWRLIDANFEGFEFGDLKMNINAFILRVEVEFSFQIHLFSQYDEAPTYFERPSTLLHTQSLFLRVFSSLPTTSTSFPYPN